MKVLAIGDITGTATIPYLRNTLYRQRSLLGADFVVANGENVSDIRGISASDAQSLLDCGIDVITTGNHVWGRYDIYGMLDSVGNILRPANYPACCPGIGSTVLHIGGWRMLCINIMGTVYMDALDSPFDTVDKILAGEKGRYDFSLLDIHAEATSEKMALARYFDGRINIIFGTHTHVQTADEQILPNGSGYITDLGMSGPTDGIIGTDTQTVIRRFRTKMPQKFSVAQGKIKICGALFDLDTNSGRVTDVRRICF